MLQISESDRTTKFAFWALGFRPFFLLAPAVAVLELAVWLLDLSGVSFVRGYWRGMTAHAHEMIFGFAMAVVAGFLLTAARNWTGLWTWRGPRLAVLVVVWLLARILNWLSVPSWLVAVVDLIFVPMVMFALWQVLWPVRQYRNFIFMPVLLLMWLGNFLMHADRLGWIASVSHHGLYLGLDILLVLISLLGGRVIPFFTERGLGLTSAMARTPRLDLMILAAMVLFAVAHQIQWQGTLTSVAALTALAIQGVRCFRWWRRGILGVPLLWSLHFSYWWLLVGLFMVALQPWMSFSPWLSVHAFTVGTISGMILAMMARVSLGHTGRQLSPPDLMVAGFAIIQIAAGLRVFGPWLFPEQHLFWMVASGSLWVMAMLIFVVTYGPMLIRPRMDGQPG